MVEASIKESKISGNDRDVAWDGATMGGQDLQNQVRMSPACKVLHAWLSVPGSCSTVLESLSSSRRSPTHTRPGMGTGM